MIQLSEIKPNPENPRVIRDDRFQKLVKSIKEFPKMMELRPMVVDDSFMVLGGNMRLKALTAAGYTEVPETWIKKASELSEEEKKRFIIADNVGYGDNDWDALIKGWDMDLLEDWGMEIPKGIQKLSAVEDDYVIPDEIKTDIVEGDFFEIGSHRLICGDSTQTDTFKKLFGELRADLVVTDPPYNVGYEGHIKIREKIKNDTQSDSDFFKFLYDFYTALGSYTKPGGAWYVWHADSEGANFRMAMSKAGIMVKQCLIWVKHHFTRGRQDYHWQHEPCLYGWKDPSLYEDAHEPCLYGWKEGAAHQWQSDRKQTTVLEFDKPMRNPEHPTMKPVPMIGYQILNSSKAGDIVADAFGGSGTTMIAAEQLQRRAFLVEADPKYCHVTIERMRKLVPNISIKKNGIEVIYKD